MDKKLLDRLNKSLNTCILCKRSYFDENAKGCQACTYIPNYPIVAPDEQIFICTACGKESQKLFPDEDSLWDESCSANALLIYKDNKQIVPGYERKLIKGTLYK